MTNQIDFMLELRAKSTNDLMKLSEEKRAELFALKFQAAVGSLEQTHKLKSLKKDIARIELLVSERQKAGEIKKIKPVKTNYSKAVKAADKEGQIVRKKQIEQVQQMQQGQMGMGSNVDDFTAAMMAGAGMEAPKAIEPVVKAETKVEAKPAAKPAAKKAEAKPVAKPAAKKAEAKVEAKPAAKAEAKPAAKPVAKKAEAKPAAKPVAKKAEAKPAAKPAAKKAEAKPAAKPAAKKAEAKKPSEIDVPYEDNFVAINLDLPKKPKQAKTYVFGSNKNLLDKELKDAKNNSKKK